MPRFDKTSLVVCVFVLLSNIVLADNPYYFSVPAQKGDGIIALLTKYELGEYQCNKDLFCQMNDLSPSDPLIINKEYKLPIKIYTYNGTSIRSTIGINDYKRAVRIQKYNETILAKGLRKTHFRDSKILWVPHHEMECQMVPLEGERQLVSEKEQKAPDSITKKVVATEGNLMVNKLFGSEYEEFKIKDYSLKNQVFYLVSGHGGPDPGALCKKCPDNMCEDEYAYDVALRLSRKLMEHGATVHMIIEDKNDGIRDEKYLECDKDERTLTGAKLPHRQLDRLKQRADAVNKLYYKYKKKKVKSQKVVMIHVDSRGKDKRQDVFFYYWGNNKKSKKLAYNMRNVFQQKYDYYQKGRGYKGYVDKRGLYMLRKTIPTSVYVELANIRNKSDHKRLIFKENRQALANWLYEGLI